MSFQDDWFKDTPGTLAWQWKRDQREREEQSRRQLRELSQQAREADRIRKERRRIQRAPADRNGNGGAGSTAVPGSSQKEGGASGRAILGAIVGAFLAVRVGTPVVGGLIFGAIAGTLLIPVLRLLGRVTVGIVKLAIIAILILFVLGAIGSLFGG